MMPFLERLFQTCAGSHFSKDLLVAQSDDRIDTRRATRGKVASQEDNAEQQKTDNDKRDWIRGTNLEKKARNVFAEGQRQPHTDGHT